MFADARGAQKGRVQHGAALGCPLACVLTLSCQGDPVGQLAPDAAASGGDGALGGGGSAGKFSSAGSGGSGGASGAGSGGASGSGALGGSSGVDGGPGGSGGGSGASGCAPSCAVELLPNTYNVLDLAIDAQDVFYVSIAGLGKVPKSGGKASSLASGDYRGPVIADATHVYFFDASQTLLKVNKTGGAAVSFAASDGSVPQRITLVAGYVYWTTFPGGVYRLLTTGGTPEKLSPSGSSPYGVAANATYAWWSNRTAVTEQPPSLHTHI